MSVTPGETTLLLVAAALLALDHAAWPSLLVSQPLVAGALGGVFLGHLEAGLAAGAVVQMLVLRVQPVGGTAVAEAWLGGLAAALAAPADICLRGGAWLDDGRLAAPVAVGILAMWLGRWALVAQRRVQGRLASRVAAALERDDTRPLERAHLAGLALHAARGVLLCGLVLVAAPPLGAALGAAGLVAPAGRLGLAIAAASVGQAALRRGRRKWLLAGAVAGLLLALAGCGSP